MKYRRRTKCPRYLWTWTQMFGFSLWGLTMLVSCAKGGYYDIDTRTELTDTGHTVIRWQVNPGMEGSVKIYASSDATSYPTMPVAEEKISKKYATLPYPEGHFETQYFLMVFDGKETRIVSSRTIPTVSFTNLRDMGGYMTKEGDQMRWGRIYRSNDLAQLTESDVHLIRAIGIRSQIYLQNSPLASTQAIHFPEWSRVGVKPDVRANIQLVKQRIVDGLLDQPAVVDAREDLMNSYVFENPNQLSTALHYLLDESHYPVLLSDSLGNGRVSVLASLIQTAVGVPQNEILKDYMLSNALTPVARLEPEGYKLSPLAQEALIEFYRNRPNDLQYIYYEIIRRYGSVEGYLDKVLSFDSSDIAHLKEILLY